MPINDTNPLSGTAQADISGTKPFDGDMMLYSDPHEIGRLLKNLYQEMYNNVEALEAGSPFWEMGGKHFEAYRTQRKVKKVARDIGDMKLSAYLQLRQGEMSNLVGSALQDHSLDVHHQVRKKKTVLEDDHKRLELGLRIKRLSSALESFNEEFNSSTFRDLPEELKTKMFEDIYTRIIDEVFAVDEEVDTLINEDSLRSVDFDINKRY